MNIFSGKRYFNAILWAPANNNNDGSKKTESFVWEKNCNI
jgi:hypothetical protein